MMMSSDLRGSSRIYITPAQPKRNPKAVTDRTEMSLKLAIVSEPWTAVS